MTAPAVRRGAPLMLWLLVVVWVCNVADLLLTRAALSAGRATESNAAMAFLFRQGTSTAAAAKIAVVSLGVILLRRCGCGAARDSSRTYEVVLYSVL